MKKFFAITIFLIASSPVIAQELWTDYSHKLMSKAIYLRTMDVQAADFNGDGHIDLVLAIEWHPNTLLLGDGKGQFIDAGDGRLANIPHDSEDIAIADFDGNGLPDIIFAAEDDSTHELYLNTGDANFKNESNRLPQFISNAVIAGDINSDGYPDLIFGNQGQSRIFINDGKANFKDETATRMPLLKHVTQDVRFVDVDNDGDEDMFLANEDGNTLLINNGKGLFADESNTRLPQAEDMETRKITVFDANGDGAADLFLSNVSFIKEKNSQDRLYLNNGKGYFKEVTTFNLPGNVYHTLDAVPADIDKDGDLDLIVAYMDGIPPALLLNDSRGKFTELPDAFPLSASGNNIALLLIDVNEDGQEDLYIGGFQSPDKLLLRKGD